MSNISFLIDNLIKNIPKSIKIFKRIIPPSIDKEYTIQLNDNFGLYNSYWYNSYPGVSFKVIDLEQHPEIARQMDIFRLYNHIDFYYILHGDNAGRIISKRDCKLIS